MIRYRSALEQIAALAHIGSHAGRSINEMLEHFVMVEHLANKALYNPGQPRLAVQPKPRAGPKAVARSQRSRSRAHGGPAAHPSIKK